MIDTIKNLQEIGLLAEIRSCHFDNLADVHLYLKDGTKIIFGKTTDMDYKLSVLSAVLEQVNRSEGTYIDLSVPDRTISGTIDPTPAPTPAPEEAPAEATEAPEETDAPTETEAPAETEEPEETKSPETEEEPSETQRETEETNTP